MRQTAALRWALAAVLLLLSLAAGEPAEAGESFLVIVNSANPVTSLTPDDVSKLFLGKVRSWEHGDEVRPVDQASDSSLRERFSEEIHGRSVDAIKAYWQQQVFAGLGVGPPELGSDREVMDHVERHSGGIGYVSSSAPTQDVKVIEIRE